MLPSTLEGLAVWMLSAGAAAFIVSVLYERWTWFLALLPSRKRWVVFGTFVGLPLVGIALQVLTNTLRPLPAEFYQWVSLVGNAMLQGLFAWASSQFIHGADRANNNAG